MEVTFHKITMFSCSDDTLSMNTNTTWVTDHFTCHVFCRMSCPSGCCWSIATGFSAYWPLCDVIWPFVGCYRSWGFAKSENGVRSCSIVDYNMFYESFSNNNDCYVIKLPLSKTQNFLTILGNVLSDRLVKKSIWFNQCLEESLRICLYDCAYISRM